ncbi:MAG: regulatory protein RecX [Actinomycetota bacterium]
MSQSKKKTPETLPIPDRRRFATELALRLLSRRECTALEVREKLRAKGFDAETVAVTTLELEKSGLLSNSRYAEAFAREAGERRGYAPAEVRRRLRSKGVEREIAAQSAAISPEDEHQRARSIAARKARSLRSYPRDTQFRRLVGFLTRRGYSPSVAARVASELLSSADPSVGN